jgi:hypothetical protein
MRGFLLTKNTGQKFLVYLQVMLQSAKICGSFGKGVGGLFSCDTHQIAAVYHGKRVDFVLAPTMLYTREYHWSGAVPWNEGLPWVCLFQELPAPQAGQP